MMAEREIMERFTITDYSSTILPKAEIIRSIVLLTQYHTGRGSSDHVLGVECICPCSGWMGEVTCFVLTHSLAITVTHRFPKQNIHCLCQRIQITRKRRVWLTHVRFTGPTVNIELVKVKWVILKIHSLELREDNSFEFQVKFFVN